ncbi:MAG: hypothetical protein WCD12_02255 [Candidatus Binatus sp.]|jgi:hypothetical protein|uniref:hypothetical protein n=1 Tax=Candidatus Binatus sp. TaxID=2811406 RepID=UPI003C763091
MAGPYFQKKSWPSFVYRGTTHDLIHLNEYELVVVDTGGHERRIAVTFGDHCFTRAPTPGDDPALAYRDSDRRPGNFCFVRYALTFGLRQHINDAVVGRVWNVEGDHFAAVPEVDSSGKRVSYGIIFSLDRVTGLPVHLHMRIKTAYPINLRLVTFGSVRFLHLVALRMKGKRPQKDHQRRRKVPRIR